MSAPTLTAIEKHERQNLEAARIIVADASTTGLQRTWAEAFLARHDAEQEQQRLPFSENEVTR